MQSRLSIQRECTPYYYVQTANISLDGALTVKVEHTYVAWLCNLDFCNVFKWSLR